ncbi:hypothetical protein TcasGA2_TC001445 [Tribolium castaneum]|uniref:Uncharacterized protein n=1 Tax=Tribolium castaneum TaxID=7070 RepID=D7EIJ4_TRICA|nr:hypothetical protein TcasGA2_TC001445 [Tribolium castaneum]
MHSLCLQRSILSSNKKKLMENFSKPILIPARSENMGTNLRKLLISHKSEGVGVQRTDLIDRNVCCISKAFSLPIYHLTLTLSGKRPNNATHFRKGRLKHLFVIGTKLFNTAPNADRMDAVIHCYLDKIGRFLPLNLPAKRSEQIPSPDGEHRAASPIFGH